MKTIIALTAASLAVTLLGGCATTGQSTSNYQPQQNSQSKQYRYVTDDEYVRYYEKTAMRRNFVHVNWVNLPQKKVAVAEGDE